MTGDPILIECEGGGCSEHLMSTGRPGLSQCVACWMRDLVEDWE